MHQDLIITLYFAAFMVLLSCMCRKVRLLALGSSEAFLSSQETLNKVDAPIIGEGTQLTT